MKNYITNITILLIFIFLNERANSQQIIEFISVKINVIGKQSSCDQTNTREEYFAVSSITNNQDTTISFWIMDAGWPDFNWKINNDSVKIVFSGADRNVPIKIKLLSKQTMNFNFLLQPKQNGLINLKFRMGFLYFPRMGQLWDEKYRYEPKVYWSDISTLQDNLYQAYFEK